MRVTRPSPLVPLVLAALLGAGARAAKPAYDSPLIDAYVATVRLEEAGRDVTAWRTEIDRLEGEWNEAAARQKRFEAALAALTEGLARQAGELDGVPAADPVPAGPDAPVEAPGAPARAPRVGHPPARKAARQGQGRADAGTTSFGGLSGGFAGGVGGMLSGVGLTQALDGLAGQGGPGGALAGELTRLGGTLDPGDPGAAAKAIDELRAKLEGLFGRPVEAAGLVDYVLVKVLQEREPQRLQLGLQIGVVDGQRKKLDEEIVGLRAAASVWGLDPDQKAALEARLRQAEAQQGQLATSLQGLSSQKAATDALFAPGGVATLAGGILGGMR